MPNAASRLIVVFTNELLPLPTVPCTMPFGLNSIPRLYSSKVS
jgi:hypothetical protein